MSIVEMVTSVRVEVSEKENFKCYDQKTGRSSRDHARPIL